MRELPGQQQSDRWIRNRIGRITASRMADVMHVLTRKSKNGEAGDPGGRRLAYRRELIAERILKRASDHPVTPYMEEGSAREDEARSNYELATNQMVIPVGFVLHPRFDWTGASADGLIGDDGCLEIKSPKPETLLEWIESNEIPEDYLYQAQWEMACCERKFCDFYGWYPGMPHFFRTIPRSDELIERMEQEAQSLHLDVEAFLAKNSFPPTTWVDEAPFEEPPAYDDSKSFADNVDLSDEFVIP
jgi:putative phage-type endonuclease